MKPFSRHQNFEPSGELGSRHEWRGVSSHPVAAATRCNLFGISFGGGSSTTNNTSNAQTTTGNAAEGSTQTTIGSNAFVQETAAGGIGAYSESGTVNITSENPALIAQIGDYLQTTANNSIIAQNDTVTKALGFGSEALASNNDISNKALALANSSITANNASLASALGFGSEAVNSVVSVAAQGQQEAQAANYAAQQTIADIADKFANIAANAAPQTAAAQQELLNGTSPAGGSSSYLPSSDFAKIAVIVGVLASAVAIFGGFKKVKA